VRALDLATLDASADELDRAISRTRDIDHFCSSSAWVIPAHLALNPPRSLFARRGTHGWALFARQETEEWSTLQPLEMGWCLAAPFACPEDPEGLSAEFADECRAAEGDQLVFLSGLVPRSRLLQAMVTAFRRDHLLLSSSIPPCVRYRASLEGGLGGFLSRRSPGFRAKLRQAARKAARAGLSFEEVPVATERDALAVHARLVTLESKSWKGKAGEGLVSPAMQEFYRLMLPRLARRGALRALVGRIGGEDVAMIVGGVIDTPDGVAYRGLQFSFDDEHRVLSPGNLAQLAMMDSLVREGVALYDLGSDVDYKRRWGEQCLTTITIVAIPATLAARATAR
jgi:hypothetical protein